MTDIAIPDDLWDDSDEAALSTWLYADGDQVQCGAVLAELVVAKSSFELLAPASGVLRIAVAAEEPVAKRQVVGRID